MKNVIITIDTEGDNLWNWNEGKEITTNNVSYLERFQILCNEYEFIPVWLSSWEMINDDEFVEFSKFYMEKGLCEIGMHLHAWNTPPIYSLNKDGHSGAPYLIEYPDEIIEEKIKTITECFEKKYGFKPCSHRAGRWTMNDRYFELLAQYGYKVDCSITPGIDWSNLRGRTPNSQGSNYKKESNNVKIIKGIMEVPVYTQCTHKLFHYENSSLIDYLKEIKHSAKGKILWLRPTGKNLSSLLYLVDCNLKSDSDYIMFMIHSSELMPGGSPYFKDEASIEKLYYDIEILFKRLSKEYEGISLERYYEKKIRTL